MDASYGVSLGQSKVRGSDIGPPHFVADRGKIPKRPQLCCTLRQIAASFAASTSACHILPQIAAKSGGGLGLSSFAADRGIVRRRFQPAALSRRSRQSSAAATSDPHTLSQIAAKSQSDLSLLHFAA